MSTSANLKTKDKRIKKPSKRNAKPTLPLFGQSMSIVCSRTLDTPHLMQEGFKNAVNYIAEVKMKELFDVIYGIMEERNLNQLTPEIFMMAINLHIGPSGFNEFIQYGAEVTEKAAEHLEKEKLEHDRRVEVNAAQRQKREAAKSAAAEDSD